MAPKKSRNPPAEPLMHSIYCDRYLRKNREECNRKTRERMARLRASDVMVAPKVLAARLEARRAAAKKYREKCSCVIETNVLRIKAREARARAANERQAAKDREALTERREAARKCTMSRHADSLDPEGGWANASRILPLTTSREMVPGPRQDILDDHHSQWDWRMFLFHPPTFGLTLHSRLAGGELSTSNRTFSMSPPAELQRGETGLNLDYVFAHLMRDSAVPSPIVYDHAAQWRLRDNETLRAWGVRNGESRHSRQWHVDAAIQRVAMLLLTMYLIAHLSAQQDQDFIIIVTHIWPLVSTEGSWRFGLEGAIIW
ncbi:hypothetical protein B0H19DRAFT_1055596 [Mycena capillaripes]|nr:hypothetical protein B0H19DRAFT_1055596 [Mycena capillaripes]